MKPDRNKPGNSKRPDGSNQPVKTSSAAVKGNSAEDREPTAGMVHVPTGFILLFGILLYISQLYLNENAGEFDVQVHEPYLSAKQLKSLHPVSGDELLVARGEALYGSVCVGCHQATGLGSANQAPPLVGSEWVLGSPARLVRIPMHGLTGSIQVKGQEWALQMPAFGNSPDAALKDDNDIASVLSFIRNSWGNKAPVIKPELVKEVREQTKGRATQMTSPELLAIP